MKRELFAVSCLPAMCAAACLFACIGFPAHAENHPEGTRFTPLVQAAYQGDMKTLQELVAQGADVNENDGAPLYFAAGAGPITNQKYKGSLEAVKFLLEHGAKMDGGKRGITPLRAAIDNRNEAIARFLVERHADVNIRSTFGDTALMDAIQRHEWEIAQLLLDHGADFKNPVDINGDDTLMHAVMAVRSLESIPMPANPSFFNLLWWSLNPPPEEIDFLQAIDLVKQLLDKDAPIDHISNSGDSAFTAAAAECHNTLVEALLKHGADVNQRNKKSGETALMSAAWCGNPRMVKTLLDHHADKTLKDNFDRTALDLAKKSNAQDVVALLKN